MIRHCVTFRFVPGTSADAIAALEAALGALPDTIDEIQSYWVGPDLGLRDTNADFAVVADFADEAAFLAYSGHPDHLAVIENLLVPIAAERNTVQFTW